MPAKWTRCQGFTECGKFIPLEYSGGFCNLCSINFADSVELATGKKIETVHLFESPKESKEPEQKQDVPKL